MPDSGFFSVLGAQPEGVYVNRWPGLGLISWDGAARWITHEGYWQAIWGGDAYGTAKQPGEPGPIIRLDLALNDTTEVFSRQGMTALVTGFGTGNKIVIEARNDTTDEVWLVGATDTKLMSESSQFSVSSALADNSGTWIATTKGLYLYTSSSGLELASTASSGWLASRCL